MTIILDENLPHGLLRMLAPRPVTTVQQVGYAGMQNGELLAALEGICNIFLLIPKLHLGTPCPAKLRLARQTLHAESICLNSGIADAISRSKNRHLSWKSAASKKSSSR